MLRPWQGSDAHVLVEAFRDPAIQRWHRRRIGSADEARELISKWAGRWRAETSANWAVVDTGTGDVLGRTSLRNVRLDEGIAECTYWVLPTARRERVATRATRELSRWALNVLGLRRLELAHSVDNPASCRVAQRSGFQLEGVMRSALLHADGWHDMHLHARIQGDEPPAE